MCASPAHLHIYTVSLIKLWVFNDKYMDIKTKKGERNADSKLFSSRCSGRSYSKDSQKSSQSDLSMASAGGGSPKLLAITPLREYITLCLIN